ncbi:hypothetical protein PR048_014721 [Dryococelus australis]|uniref:Reverse transcriptase domain-containing protein n=1 Tax=Dryococelus australis TaxID=614101 RepID=A0ABQ9HF00_9NEOP|nr:hypothetical protein PR048_014721 [Dryococelus australis]
MLGFRDMKVFLWHVLFVNLPKEDVQNVHHLDVYVPHIDVSCPAKTILNVWSITYFLTTLYNAIPKGYHTIISQIPRKPGKNATPRPKTRCKTHPDHRISPRGMVELGGGVRQSNVQRCAQTWFHPSIPLGGKGRGESLLTRSLSEEDIDAWDKPRPTTQNKTRFPLVIRAQTGPLTTNEGILGTKEKRYSVHATSRIMAKDRRQDRRGKVKAAVNRTERGRRGNTSSVCSGPAAKFIILREVGDRGGLVVRLLASCIGEPGRSRIFACGNRARRSIWSVGFLGISRFTPALLFWRCSIDLLPSLHPTGSQDLDVKCYPDFLHSTLTGSLTVYFEICRHFHWLVLRRNRAHSTALTRLYVAGSSRPTLLEQIHSSLHADAAVVDKITQGFFEHKHSILILLDLAKAFDSVQYLALLSKLHNFNIHERLISVLHSFLAKRSFTVRVDHHLTSYHSITAGVPQGALLSTTFFSIYVADIPSIPDVMLYQYADDTAILLYSQEAETLSAHVRLSLRILGCSLRILLDQFYEMGEFRGPLQNIRRQTTRFLTSIRRHHNPIIASIAVYDPMDHQPHRRLLDLYIDPP